MEATCIGVVATVPEITVAEVAVAEVDVVDGTAGREYWKHLRCKLLPPLPNPCPQPALYVSSVVCDSYLHLHWMETFLFDRRSETIWQLARPLRRIKSSFPDRE